MANCTGGPRERRRKGILHCVVAGRWRPRISLGFLLVLLLLAGGFLPHGAQPAVAQAGPQLPPGFSASVIAEGLTLPTDLELLPNNDILVAEKGVGKDADGVSHVRLIRNGVLAPDPVVTLSTHVEKDSGILGLVIDPDFEQNHYFYVWYGTGAHALRANTVPYYRLSRFKLDMVSGSVDPSGEKILLDGVSWSNSHGGGGLIFDQEGNLFVATGDHGERESAQDLRGLSGKILRISPREDGYVVPQDNPFTDVPDAHSEIYASGLRNPFRMARNGSGLVVVADVGDEKWEEVNRVASGANFGWPEREGPCLRNKREPCGSAPPQFTDPLAHYLHDGGGAITGLAFYEGDAFPSQYHDVLFYADFDQGVLSTIDLYGAEPSLQPFAANMPGIVDLAYGNNGLYYVDIIQGQIGLIYYPKSTRYSPQVTLTADATFGPAPLTVHLSTDGSADPNRLGLRYRWDFGDGSIPVETTANSISHRYTQDGSYTVRLQATNALNESSPEVAQEIVVYSGEVPRIRLSNLTEPGRQQFYANDRWAYQAERTGGTTGLDPDAPYRWRVDLHHNQHNHPVVVEQVAVSDTIDLAGNLHDGIAWNLWFRFYLTTLTEGGQQFTFYEEIEPALSSVDFGSAPEGASIAIDGVPYGSDYVAKTIVGATRTLSASQSMLHDRGVWVFDHWTTPAGEQTQRNVQITVPPTGATLTAHYVYDRPAQQLHVPLVTR